MRDVFKPKSNKKPQTSSNSGRSGQRFAHGQSGSPHQGAQKKNRLKQFLFPFLLFVGVLIISFGWLFSSELSLTLDNEFLPTTHTAQSELVIVPPPQTDMVSPPDLNFETLAKRFSQPGFIEKIKSTASNTPQSVKEYELLWQAQPDTYSLLFTVKGSDPQTAVSLAETGAKLALADYHHGLDLLKSKLSPFLKNRLSTTEKQLAAIQTKVQEKHPPQHLIQLNHQIRHLQQEKELLQTMVKTQTELTTEQQSVWKQYARIQKHGHLVKDENNGFHLLPALGLASLCLVGVWLLKEERLSPDELLQTAQLKPISFDNSKFETAGLDNPAQTAPDSKQQTAFTDATKKLDFPKENEIQEEASPSNNIGTANLEPFYSEASWPLSPLSLQSPFIYGPKLLKLFNNPAIQNTFYTLLNQLTEKEMPSVVGVVNSPELATALALSLSTQNQLTSLVDLNLSNPSLHKIFQVENDWGVCQLLSDPLGPNLSLAPPTLESPLMVLPAGKFNSDQESQALFFEHLSAVLHPLKHTAEDPQRGLPIILNLPDIDNTELFERCMTQSGCEGILVVSTSQEEISPLQKSFLSAYQLDQSAIGWLQMIHWDMLLES